jgi:hypothetical protein
MCTFYPFPCLPTELRDQIWLATVEPVRSFISKTDSMHTYAIGHVQRTVEVRRARKLNEMLGQLVSCTPVPPILQACKEARAQGLYTQVFFEVDAKDAQFGAEPIATEHRYVWLNFEFDMVDIGTSLFCYYKHIMSDFQWLRFERENGGEYFYHGERRELAEFVNVKEVQVVCADGFWNWGGAINDGNHYWPCPDENVLFFDGDQIARGLELEDICDRIRDLPFEDEVSSYQAS